MSYGGLDPGALSSQGLPPIFQGPELAVYYHRGGKIPPT